jgi:hypothetical protein
VDFKFHNKENTDYKSAPVKPHPPACSRQATLLQRRREFGQQDAKG